MSKARQKGTGFENHLLNEYLVSVWPEAQRAALSGINDYGDFINVDGWHIEARNRNTWAIGEWIRGVYKKMRRKHGSISHPWIIAFKGDKRGELAEDYAVLPMWLLTFLLLDMKHAE